jgi:hypothetical protein
VFEYTGPTIAAPLPTPSSGTKTRSLSSNRPSIDGVVTYVGAISDSCPDTQKSARRISSVRFHSAS